MAKTNQTYFQAILGMKRKVFGACMLMFILTSMAFAQPTITSNVTVSTNPPGAEVQLVGDPSVAGISPTTFHYPLAGSYVVLITRPGYETYRTRVLIDPATPFSMSVDLTRKTALKAAARSIFIPGWGQQYMGERTKGLLFHSLAILSVGAFLLADNDFTTRRDRYENSIAVYDRAQSRGESFDQLSQQAERVRIDQEDAYNAETRRWVTAGAVGAVWGLSVLDALLFSPEERATYSSPTNSSPGLSIKLGSDGRTSSLASLPSPGLTLSLRW